MPAADHAPALMPDEAIATDGRAVEPHRRQPARRRYEQLSVIRRPRDTGPEHGRHAAQATAVGADDEGILEVAPGTLASEGDAPALGRPRRSQLARRMARDTPRTFPIGIDDEDVELAPRRRIAPAVERDESPVRRP